MTDSIQNNYIVYTTRITETQELVYIGSGLEGREQHVTSGISHNYFLNCLHFNEIEVNVEVIHTGLTKQESLDIELDLIRKNKPIFNRTNRNLGYKEGLRIYKEDPEQLKTINRSMYDVIEKLGEFKLRSAGFNRKNIEDIYQMVIKSSQDPITDKIYLYFAIDTIYSHKTIKSKLQSFGLSKAKSTTIQNYFEVKVAKTHKGENGFKLIRKL